MNKNNTGKYILIALLSILLLTGAFSGGVIVGWMIPSTSPLEAIAAAPTSPIVVDETAAPLNLETLFTPFWEAWQIVHDQYVDQPVDDLKLMQGAIRGMIDALEDKHSSFMNPDEYQQATMPLDGSYTGIGAYVDTSGEVLTITKPMPGFPAERAGLKTGDEVITIDGKDVTQIDPGIVLKSILGPAGSEVKLGIHRPETDETLEFSIIREVILLPSIESETLDGNIGYVALYTFADTTSEDLKSAIREIMAQDPVGIILDLRNNSGGYLDTAIEVISQFIPDGVVMIEQMGDGEEVSYEAIPGGLATEIPLVVLVNEWSASASEITAGAIQDLARGTVIGTTTYGKGSVQNWVPLNNNQGAVRVTIARWLTPNGRQINSVGLTPDIVVELTEDDITAETDPQLQQAIDLLLNGIR